jgi:hypothetical protein
VEKIVFPKGTPDPKKGGTSRQRPGDVSTTPMTPEKVLPKRI